VSDRAPGAAILGLLLAATAAFYSPLLGIGYLADDHDLLAPIVAGEWSPAEPFPAGSGMYRRPLVMASLLPGDRPVLHHAVNLLLHLGAVGLVFAAARAVAETGTALFAAAVFAVHPAVVPTVAWIAGRTESVCGLFFLAGVAWFVHGARAGGGAGRLALAALAVVPAALSKETGLTLPLALALLAAALPAPSAAARRRAWTSVAAAAVLAGALALPLGVGRGGAGLGSGPAGIAGAGLVLVNAMFLRLPEFHLRRWGAEWGHLAPWAVAGAAAVALAAGWIVLRVLRRRGRAARLPRRAALLLLPFVPALPVLALGWARERHAYLPLALLLIALAAFAGERRWGRRGAAAGAALVVLLASLAGRREVAWIGAARLVERTCGEVREAAAELPPGSPLVLPVVTASRAEAPVFSNDARETFHRCLRGRFGRLEHLHVYALLEIGPAGLDPAEAVEVAVQERALEVAARPGAHFGRARAPGTTWGDSLAEATVLRVDPYGDLTAFRLTPRPGLALRALIPSVGGLGRVELTAPAPGARRSAARPGR